MGTLRFFRLIVPAFLAFLLLSGCGEEKPDHGPEAGSPARAEMAILLYRGDDVYISLVREAMEKHLADRAGCLLYDARDDAALQEEQLRDALGRGVKGLAVNLVDVQAAGRVIEAARRAGVPVVFFNREPDMDVVRGYAGARYVGTTAEDAGKLQGDLIAELWRAHREYDKNEDGTFQYVMLQGNADNLDAQARTEWSVRRAGERGVAMEQLGQTFVCNWDRELARQSMEFAYAEHGDDIELVIANNDAMALGAIYALARHAYNTGDREDRFIPVVGVDGAPEAVEAISRGVMSATVRQDAGAMGRVVTQMLLNSLQGKDFLEGSGLDWDAGGVAVRIPYTLF